MNPTLAYQLQYAQKRLLKEGWLYQVARDAIKSVGEKLAGLPLDIALRLLDYWQSRACNESEYNANLGLRDRIQELMPVVESVTLDWAIIQSDGRIELFADGLAKDNYNLMSASAEAGLVKVWELVNEHTKEQGVEPPALPKSPTDEDYYSALVRLCDPVWCQRRITRMRNRIREHLRIAFGDVRKKVSPYVSSECLSDHRAKQRAAERWAQEMELINEQGDVVSMADAIASSTANPDNRRHELMVRIRGMEDLADDSGLSAYFVTLTCPAKFHKASGAKWQGNTPKEAQAYLNRVWQNTRARWSKFGIRCCGIRVAEPHHDATPHWHLLLWFRPDEAKEGLYIFRRYAVAEEQTELQQGYLSRKRAKKTRSGEHWYSVRFDAEPIDQERGSATGYIAKYLSKNIDGKQHIDFDHEAETTAQTGAERVRVWASRWGIRQFQFIGGAPVTVWRECRRIEKQTDPVLESIRINADAGNWAGFVREMGGLFAARADRPAHTKYEEIENQYGEPAAKVVGIYAGLSVAVSRLWRWQLRKREAPEQSASGAPWSSDNNCNRLSQRVGRGRHWKGEQASMAVYIGG